MLHKACLCWLACVCALLTNPVLSVGTFYKLAGKHDEASVADENVPFLTKPFFSCGSNQDCAKIAKNEGSSEFKEVNDQQEVKEDAVVYEKINNPKTQGIHYIAISCFRKVHCFWLFKLYVVSMHGPDS